MLENITTSAYCNHDSIYGVFLFHQSIICSKRSYLFIILSQVKTKRTYVEIQWMSAARNGALRCGLGGGRRKPRLVGRTLSWHWNHGEQERKHDGESGEWGVCNCGRFVGGRWRWWGGERKCMYFFSGWRLPELKRLWKELIECIIYGFKAFPKSPIHCKRPSRSMSSYGASSARSMPRRTLRQSN